MLIFVFEGYVYNLVFFPNLKHLYPQIIVALRYIHNRHAIYLKRNKPSLYSHYTAAGDVV